MCLEGAGFISEVTEAQLKRERAKARVLRQSQWWKRKRGAGVCYYCDRQVGARNLTMDHVVPMIRGGRSTRGNVVPACKVCNTEKQLRLPVEWEEYLRRLAARPTPQGGGGGASRRPDAEGSRD